MLVLHISLITFRLIFSSVFGTCRFCLHHNFLPSFNPYRSCLPTAAAMVVNAVALRYNLTRGTFINFLRFLLICDFHLHYSDSPGGPPGFSSSLVASHSYLIFLAMKRWKVLMKSIRHIWQENKCSLKKNDGLGMTTYTSLYQKQLPRVALRWEKRTGWVACWFLQILCQSS